MRSMMTLHAVAEIQVIPIGVGVSVRPWIEKVVELIEARGFEVESHAYGTNVEGELDAITALVGDIHRFLHSDGVPRVSTVVKIGTRTDKAVRLVDKRVR